MKRASVFLFAGEASGDVHGEKLFSTLRKKDPLLKIYGVGGPKMRSAGFESILNMEEFQVMGFVDVFFALPKLIYHFFSLRRRLLKDKPDVVILIDYPGFNLAMAKTLRKASFPGKICQYICPSVWAWGKHRVKKMEAILDHLFVIFPFEKQLFNPEKLKVAYVGHPLVHKIETDRCRPLEMDEKKRVIALFPGSREKELMRNFPLQVRVAKQLHKKYPDLLFAISVANPSFSPLLEEILSKEEFGRGPSLLFVNASQNGALMKRSTLALAKSGTNNLELALHQVPTVVTYGVSPLDLFIAQKVLKIDLPYYSIVNLLLQTEVFPELIGPYFTEDALFTKASHLLSSPEASALCREKCVQLAILLEKKAPEEEIYQVIFS